MTISTTLHDVQSITVSKLTSLGRIVDRTSYFRILKVVTDSGETFELTLFSPDLHALSVVEENPRD